MSDTKLRAHCVDQEYWHVHRTPCECGGQLSHPSHELVKEDDGPVDVLTATCLSCGTEQVFRFDVSPFFSRESQKKKIEEALAGIDEKVVRKIRPRLGPPMPRAISFIRQLGHDGDLLALDYLQEELDAARSAESK